MYLCTACHYASVTKLGKCPDCSSFGTFVSDASGERVAGQGKKGAAKGQVLSVSFEATQSIFYPFGEEAYYRVFSHGLKQGGIYLLGGEPGIGKSTLMLQIIEQIGEQSIGYFSGEEQVNEVVRRGARILQKKLSQQTGYGGKHLSDNVQIYHTTSLEDIISTTKEHSYKIIIIDSIQTIASNNNDALAGSPNQVKYCADVLVSFCRMHDITLFCLGHVTKGGEIAGPKYLEHIVDVVLYLEGDRYGQYRTLRTSKNRFGGTDDAVVFRMTEHGLVVVGNDFRVHTVAATHPGRALTIGLENGRPILVTVEALLTKNYTNHPQRTALGIDPKRLQLIIAILEKYCKCRLYQFDIFVNIPGEFTFYDSGIDLAIAAVIYSQYQNSILPENAIYIGEIGLSGHIVKPKLYEKRQGVIQGDFVLIDSLGRDIAKILMD